MALIPLVVAALIGPVRADTVTARLPGAPWRVAATGSAAEATGWFEDRPWGISSRVGLYASSIEIEVVSRRPLSHGDGAWSAQAYLAGGVVVPMIAPGAGLTLSPAIDAGWTGQRLSAHGALTVPLAAGWSAGWALTVPVLLEPRVGIRLGRWWWVLFARAGPNFTPGVDTSVVLEPGIAVSFCLPRFLEPSQDGDAR